MSNGAPIPPPAGATIETRVALIEQVSSQQGRWFERMTDSLQTSIEKLGESQVRLEAIMREEAVGRLAAIATVEAEIRAELKSLGESVWRTRMALAVLGAGSGAAGAAVMKLIGV